MASVELDKLTKVYPNGTTAVADLDLLVPDGEFMVLVGPSGCGKTTALRMVAGLEKITSGTLTVGGRVVNELPPKSRDVAMVFQNYALYPHMTVAENMGFALRLRRLSKSEVAAKVAGAADILGLTEHLDRRPGQLSGGQRQRVAMGRAIVRDPSVFLMDEPLSNLDAKLRVQMRAEIARVQRRIGVATFYVTHDQTEAMTMGDRVAVMRAGKLQQCDAPQRLYDQPVNLFVASFIGSPAMNLYEATLRGDGSGILIGDQELSVPPSVLEQRPGLGRYRDAKLVVGIRPEDFWGMGAPDDTGDVLAVDVELVEALGNELQVHFHLDATPVPVDEATDGGGADVVEGGPGAAAREVDAVGSVARLEPRSPVRAGERGRLRVRTSQLHFFDHDTATAIWH